MTPTEAHKLAQQSPVKSLTTRLGELKEQADNQTANLAATLKHIDDTRHLLNQHGIQMTVDLGEIGNAAANARRQLEAGKVTPKTTFELPRKAA